jgi:hypothetical protein
VASCYFGLISPVDDVGSALAQTAEVVACLNVLSLHININDNCHTQNYSSLKAIILYA